MNDVGKITGQPHAKERNWTPTLHHTKRINSKWIKHLNIRPETVKFQEENTGGKHPDVSLRSDVFDLTPKANNQQAGLHQPKKLHSKGNNKMRNGRKYVQPTEWEKISANHICNTGLIPKI